MRKPVGVHSRGRSKCKLAHDCEHRMDGWIVRRPCARMQASIRADGVSSEFLRLISQGLCKLIHDCEHLVDGWIVRRPCARMQASIRVDDVSSEFSRLISQCSCRLARISQLRSQQMGRL